MRETILLIGLSDAQDIKVHIEVLDGLNTVLICGTLEDAKEILLCQDVTLFMLDIGFGEDEIYLFYQWILDHQPIYGVLVGDQFHNYLGINSLNTNFIVDYILRPMSRELCVQMLAQYNDYCSCYHRTPLNAIRGRTLHIQREPVDDKACYVC